MGKTLHFSLAAVQICFAGFEVLTRAALFKGVDSLVFTTYRNILACLVLGPVAYFLERKRRPPLKCPQMLLLFFLGFLGVTMNQMSYMLGLEYTSAVFASAMRNLTSMITFTLAVVFRFEKVNVKRRHGLAKVIGALLGFCGAVVLSAYHNNYNSNSGTVQNNNDLFTVLGLQVSRWSFGVVCLVLSFLCFAIYLLLQATMLTTYPAPFSIGAYSCFFSVLQLMTVSVITETKRSSWAVTSPTEFFSIFYAGIVGSGFVSGMQSWAVAKGGPVIVAAYQPLETVLVTLFYYIFFGQTLLPVSAIGTTLVIGGLYLLTWALEEERRLYNDETLLDPLIDE